jgi:hypothetical protein
MGCHGGSPVASVSNEPIRSDKELERILEQRWPISAIKTFCIPERRHNPFYQLLVLDSDVIWRGKLHASESTGFDSIEWMATTNNGQLETYSILVHKGDDIWEIDWGSKKSLAKPPQVSPNPNQPHFARHTGPLKDTPFDLGDGSDMPQPETK